jgi:hypothetical protein
MAILTGRIQMVQAEHDVAFFTLDLPPEQQPKGNMFMINMSHPNYSCMFSVALSALINNLRVNVRAPNGVTNEDYASIDYIMIYP